MRPEGVRPRGWVRGWGGWARLSEGVGGGGGHWGEWRGCGEGQGAQVRGGPSGAAAFGFCPGPVGPGSAGSKGSSTSAGLPVGPRLRLTPGSASLPFGLV